MDIYGIVEAVGITSSAVMSLESIKPPSISSSSEEESDKEVSFSFCKFSHLKGSGTFGTTQNTNVHRFKLNLPYIMMVESCPQNKLAVLLA